MSVINWPLLYIADPDKGRPLFAGQIYVGIEDLDPEIPVNQKQLNVVQENGTVVPVPQPFILSAGGTPTYNGDAVRLDVDGNYSIKILDKNGSQKYYIENVFEGQPVTELDIINDLSQAYEFPTVAAYKAFSTVFPVGKTIKLLDRNANFTVISGTSTGNEYNIIASSSVTQSVEILKSDTMTLNSLGVVDEASFVNALTYSGVNDVELTGKASFTQNSRIDLPSKFRLKSNKGDVVITAGSSYFSGSEFAMIYGDAATAINDSYIEGVTVIGGLTDFNNDGIDRYGIYIQAPTNTSIRHCSAETLERGIIIRNGATGGELSHNIAKNCYDQGIGYMGTSSSPITNVELHHNIAYTEGLTTERKMSGIRTEEVYDSIIYANRAHHCDVGHRWENSCDNTIKDNIGYENDSSGGWLYNFSQRNAVTSNHFFDNNVANHTDTSLTPDNKGNADTNLSGLTVENESNNNNIYGNVCYQTSDSIGFQKYGIGVNIRNLTSGSDSYNNIYGNQCFNNELNGVEDRGRLNNRFGNLENDFYINIIRSA